MPYSLCPTTIVVLAQYLSDQVHKEIHVSSHMDVQVQTCNDAPGSELRRQRQRDGGSTTQSTPLLDKNPTQGSYMGWPQGPDPDLATYGCLTGTFVYSSCHFLIR